MQTRTHTEGGEWEGSHIMKVKGVEDYILGNSACMLSLWFMIVLKGLKL